MRHPETKTAIRFRHWIKANPMKETTVFEMKDTRGKDYLSFLEVKEMQIDYGIAINSSNGVLIRTWGVEGLPDYVYLKKEKVYIVIGYPHFFCLIDIHTFLGEKAISKRKSLTSKRAKDIAYLAVDN